MAAKPLPPVEYLRQRLRYEPETGKLYWRENPAASAKWNRRYAGREAFINDNCNGYKAGRLDYVAYLAHRVIWAMCYEEDPPGQIDHIDHDRVNNRLENLRVVSHQENHRNTSRKKNNTSGHNGVSWFAASSRWSAYIMVDRRKQHLGYFAEKQDAIDARKAAEARYGFHTNHGVEAVSAPVKD